MKVLVQLSRIFGRAMEDSRLYGCDGNARPSAISSSSAFQFILLEDAAAHSA